jgi:hypothetical protein
MQSFRLSGNRQFRLINSLDVEVRWADLYEAVGSLVARLVRWGRAVVSRRSGSRTVAVSPTVLAVRSGLILSEKF